MYKFYKPILTKTTFYPRIVPRTTPSTLHYKIHKNNFNNHKLLKSILYTSICMSTSAIIGYNIGNNIHKLKTTR